jgi:hypothetical protein
MRAIEIIGTVDERHQLHLDAPLSDLAAQRVRVIVLASETDEPDEPLWLTAAVRNPAFDFLRDPAEDVYSPNDGVPFHD